MVKAFRKERIVWIDLMITLLVLEVMSYFYYGSRSALLAGMCVTAAVIAEILSLRLMHRKFT
ncbi:MAG: RnfABCDGE type electron transport complex subunit D, partial [Ruminococcus sp.]|nr:RnfABCDGE type electron transport complex subunit D [Ruminococcus sp.]